MSGSKKTMTGEAFRMWIATTMLTGIATNDADLAALLGVTRQSLYAMRKYGADRRTDLACRAITAKLKPWSEEWEFSKIKQYP